MCLETSVIVGCLNAAWAGMWVSNSQLRNSIRGCLRNQPRMLVWRCACTLSLFMHLMTAVQMHQDRVTCSCACRHAGAAAAGVGAALSCTGWLKPGREVATMATPRGRTVALPAGCACGWRCGREGCEALLLEFCACDAVQVRYSLLPGQRVKRVCVATGMVQVV